MIKLLQTEGQCRFHTTLNDATAGNQRDTDRMSFFCSSGDDGIIINLL